MKLIQLYASLSALSLISPSLGEGDTLPCPRWSDLNERPGAVGRRFFNISTCLESKTKTFTRPGTNTTAALYLTEESWQDDPSKASVLAAFEEAMNAGLDLFASHAGNASSALDIHVTVAKRARPTPSYDSWFDHLGRFRPGDVAKPCYIVMPFPSNTNSDEPTTLLRLRKELVKNMYHCVQKFHHPHMSASDMDWPWWYESIARFFDGLAFPATAELVEYGRINPDVADFPEDFPGALARGPAAALFWHHLHNTGWTTARITEWMKRQDPDIRYDYTHRELAKDPEMTGVFHGFCRAFVSRNISYPSGPIINATGSWWQRRIRSQPLALDDGEQFAYTGPVASPWYVSTYTVEISSLGKKGHSTWAAIGSWPGEEKLAVEISYWRDNRGDWQAMEPEVEEWVEGGGRDPTSSNITFLMTWTGSDKPAFLQFRASLHVDPWSLG